MSVAAREADLRGGEGPIVETRELRKAFPAAEGAGTLEVLRGVTLAVQPGEFVAITGPSGSGKSTLLHLLGALDRPSSGEVRLGGVALSGLGDAALAGLRAREVGFVFQFHFLMPELSALDNVVLPQLLGGATQAAARVRARELLVAVGLEARLAHHPGQLSGGEQQRVAIARALANRPALLLGDEPTGNLDTATGQEVFDLLRRANREQGQTTILVTHNPALAAQADREVALVDGRIATEQARARS